MIDFLRIKLSAHQSYVANVVRIKKKTVVIMKN